jgi:hypothetical protein
VRTPPKQVPEEDDVNKAPRVIRASGAAAVGVPVTIAMRLR